MGNAYICAVLPCVRRCVQYGHAALVLYFGSPLIVALHEYQIGRKVEIEQWKQRKVKCNLDASGTEKNIMQNYTGNGGMNGSKSR